MLQPLDKCINKPFKNKVRSQYQAWMVNGPFTYTPSGKKRAPSKELVLQWIHKAWQEIPADLVANSFKSWEFRTLWTALRMKLCGKRKGLELMKQTTS